jgi:Methyltransferase domain
MDALEAAHFFDHYDRFGSTGDTTRLRHRYEAIVSSNYDLFANARVLNFHSGDGRWCMAALDAGASRVVGVDISPRAIEAARSTFLEYGVSPECYQFIASDISEALETMKAGVFDLIVCQQSFELSDPRVIFGHFHRLQPKHIILDTMISRGDGPIVRFDFKLRDASATKGTRRHGAIVASPNHALIAFLCEYFRFEWRLIDWQAMGITDWTGIHDYERGRRRTYVLHRPEPAA